MFEGNTNGSEGFTLGASAALNPKSGGIRVVRGGSGMNIKRTPKPPPNLIRMRGGGGGRFAAVGRPKP